MAGILKEYISLKNLSVKIAGEWLEFKKGKIYKETEIPVKNLEDFELADVKSKEKYFKMNKEEMQANKISELEQENRELRILVDSKNKEIEEIKKVIPETDKGPKKNQGKKDGEFEEIK